MNKFILIMLFSTLISIFISNFLFNIFNIIVWSIALIFMFVNGIYFTFKLKFIQFRFIKQLKAIKPSKKDGVSSFESLSMSLASRVGVGSIAGIALAIYLGGAGVVFWMWVSGLIISANTYVESVYGSLYKEKVSNNIYVGGPSYYIKKGLSNNKLAIIYALLIIISYMAGFLTIQSNTIVNAVGVFNINHLVTISIVCILTSLIIFRDVKFLAKFSSFIVPFMAILYLIMGLYIIFNNISMLDNIFIDIINDAFGLKAGFYGLISAIILGIQRGIFASESGIGTSAITSGSSCENANKQGLAQVLGIHFTTLFICTITAFIILSSSYNTLDLVNPNGIEITLNAFNEYFGSFGGICLCIITLLFAFTTIVSGYYYGESNLKFMLPNITKFGMLLFKIITIIIIFLGSILSSNVIWSLVDTFVAFLAIINIYAIRELFDKK